MLLGLAIAAIAVTPAWILVDSGDGLVILPHSRPLISYYANSIVHLPGPFADGIRERDALPANVMNRE